MTAEATETTTRPLPRLKQRYRDEVTKRRPDCSTYTAQRSTRVARKSGEEIC